MKNEETAVALCAAGAEKVVSNELKHLGITVLDTNYGRVRFFVTLEKLYEALFCLRVADRILIEAGRFPALDFDALFESTKFIEWEKYIPQDMGVTITKVRTNRSKLESEVTLQSMAHKAIAERLCSHYKIERLPMDNTADLRIYVEKNVVSILLDVSGEPLFKRGYRLEGGVAPLRETTAAAILLLSGWRRKYPLYDPFCGAGTIAIEAALFAWDMAPGIGRDFAISKLLIANKQIEVNIRQELLSRVDFTRRIRIWGSDSNAAIVEAARENMLRAEALAKVKEKELSLTDISEAAQNKPEIEQPDSTAPQPKKTVKIKVHGVREQALNPQETSSFLSENKQHKKHITVKFSHQPRFNVITMEKAAAPPNEDEGFIVTNPPYGHRLGNVYDSEASYKLMAGLMNRFPSWKIAVITDHPGFESHFGYKADAVRNITNGAIQTYLFIYNNNSSIGYKPRSIETSSEWEDGSGLGGENSIVSDGKAARERRWTPNTRGAPPRERLRDDSSALTENPAKDLDALLSDAAK